MYNAYHAWLAVLFEKAQWREAGVKETGAEKAKIIQRLFLVTSLLILNFPLARQTCQGQQQTMLLRVYKELFMTIWNNYTYHNNY